MSNRWLAMPALLLLGIAAVGCENRAGPVTRADTPAAFVFDEAAWQPPTEADIPNDSLGASVRRGLALLRFTPESLPQFDRSALRCTSCHQNDGLKASAAPLTGAHARYPKYMGRTGAVIGLADRVNYCFTRSLAGNALPVESREMQDILSYLAFISHGIPVGTKTKGTDGLMAMKDTLVGDTTRGRATFAEKCVVCHGVDGQGNMPIPALWGARSYSIGASMAREERAASFIYHNMPQSAPGTLTPQQAFDLSAFVNSHSRPDSPGKEADFPTGGAPRDVPYATAGHLPYRPPAALLPREDPAAALVPAPVPVAHRPR
jgi:thiosulfate dehydrogenase